MWRSGLVFFVSPFVLQCIATPPVALHQLIEVDKGSEVVLHLHGHDLDGDKTTTTITTLPTSGELYQLSHIFSTHGYDPKIGSRITTVPIQIPNTSKNRIVYRRPISETWDREPYGEWDRFNYRVSDGEDESMDGTVVLVPPSRIIVGSDFRFDSEEWTTIGNDGLKTNDVVYEQSTSGAMSYYIYSTEKSINVDEDGNDQDIWYFVLPRKFHGRQSLVYGGTFGFTLSSFSGDFAMDKRHYGGEKINLVEITCERCNFNRGVTLGYPLRSSIHFNGKTTNFSLNVTETSGWMKDPKNTLHDWIIPTKCEFIEVLSSISSIRILGDFTTWYETVSIDSVRLVSSPPKGRYQIPTCAQIFPDGRRCSCR